ncbi:biotin transporter BioY [bacterium]|nr:biotin transporter BioY [bacterium]
MTNSFILADSFIPSSKVKRGVYELSIFFAGLLTLVASAQIKVFLPVSSVPFTLQTLVVLMIGVLLGSKRGTAIVSSYVLAGLVGAPFFAAPMLITSGYIFGFVASSFVIGKLIKKDSYENILSLLKVMTVGLLTIYFCGALWLSFFIGVKAAILTGVVPFIAFDIFKILVASVSIPSLKKVIK